LWFHGGAWKSLGRKHCEFEERLPKSYTNKWSGFVFFVGKIPNQNRQLAREAVYHWDTCGLYVIELVCFFLKFCFWTVWMPWLVLSIYMSMYLKDDSGVLFSEGCGFLIFVCKSESKKHTHKG
jgi:hypothetical protein